MEHPGGRSDSGRGGGRARPRPIRGGRATPSHPSVGRGGSGSSPEVPLFDMSSSPSVYLSSSPSLYMSSSPSSSTDPRQGGHQHIPSPHSQGDEGGSSSNTPIWGQKDPATGKMWIRPGGPEEFVPYNEVASVISNQIFRNFNQPWATWKDIPKDQRDRWFNEFLGNFSTLPEHHKDLKKAYNHKGSKWLSGRFYKLRRGEGKLDWIEPEIADQLRQNWAVDDKFNNRSQKNKQNRAKQQGPSYAGGSIPQSEHVRKIALSGEVPAEDVEWTAFERTHTQQSEGGERRWINPRSQQVAETYQSLTQERDSQSGTGHPSSYSDNESLLFQAAGGFNSKGRVFGYGASAGRLRQTKRSSSSTSGSEGVSADEMQKMKALVEEQAAELQETRQQQMETANELQETRQRQMQTDNELHETREMVKEMQMQIMSLLKKKGPEQAPGGDPDDDDDAAAV